jgi:hypothetical protein
MPQPNSEGWVLGWLARWQDKLRDRDPELLKYLNPYSNVVSVHAGPNRLLVDMTKFFDTITELLERTDMDNEPVAITDVTDLDTWAALIINGWTEPICQHMAAVTAAIVHRRYPAAAVMRLDHRFDQTAASLTPPYEWSYPGHHLDIAKRIVGDHLHRHPQNTYGVGAEDPAASFEPLYKTLKSTFELVIAVIGLAKTHPLYQADTA